MYYFDWILRFLDCCIDPHFSLLGGRFCSGAACIRRRCLCVFPLPKCLCKFLTSCFLPLSACLFTICDSAILPAQLWLRHHLHCSPELPPENSPGHNITVASEHSKTAPSNIILPCLPVTLISILLLCLRSQTYNYAHLWQYHQPP